MTIFRRASASTARTLLLDALACAVAGRLGEETGQVAALASALAQARKSSVIGGGHLSLAGATLLNAYLVTAVTMCDVHRATMTHVTPEVMPPALAIAERDGLSGRAPTAIAAGCEVTTRIGIGTRLSEIPRPRLARAGHYRSVRCRGRGRFAAQVRRRHNGAGVRACRQPGRRHVRGMGHANGEIPPMPRRPVRADGGAAGAAEIRRHARIPHRQGRRPLQHLCRMAANRKLAIADLGTRWELEQIAMRLWPSATLIQGMNTALFDLLDKQKIDPARMPRSASRWASRHSICTAGSTPTKPSSRRCCRRIIPPPSSCTIAR